MFGLKFRYLRLIFLVVLPVGIPKIQRLGIHFPAAEIQIKIGGPGGHWIVCQNLINLQKNDKETVSCIKNRFLFK